MRLRTAFLCVVALYLAGGVFDYVYDAYLLHGKTIQQVTYIRANREKLHR